MYSIKIFFVVVIISACSAGKPPVKRGVFEGNFAFPGNEIHFQNIPHPAFGTHPGQIYFIKPALVQKPPSIPPVSPSEIASAISAAKEASAQVLQAQQRVQIAKESVLHQQRIASQKESQAAIAAQKAEAAAAVMRQEANAAATAVVLAQQRLAQAKAEVAEHQSIASSKESHAAQVIQRSASAAAAEIQKSEHTAAKLEALQRNEATAFKHASAAKEATLSAASAAVAASASHYPAPAESWQHQTFNLGPWHK